MLTDAPSWHRDLGRSAGLRIEPPVQVSPVMRFCDIDGRIEQPPLDATILSIHLGGPKRVIRRQGRQAVEVDVAENALTLMPIGEAFSWETYGPIDFAHFRLDEGELRRAAAEDRDCDPDTLRLAPFIGVEDPELVLLMQASLADTQLWGSDGLRRDTLCTAVARRLLEGYATRAVDTGRRLGPGKLATWQIRRVTDYMRDHLAEEIDLESLVALTGLGRARFFDAFRASLGRAPFAYLLHLRLVRARMLLANTRLSVTQVAIEIGLGPTQLAVAFRRAFAMTPSAFRKANAP